MAQRKKIGMLEFSWATISLMDIGVLSISVIGLWWLKNQADRYKALSEELDKQYNTLQQEHTTLQQEFRTFQSTADRRYNALLDQHNALREAHDVLLNQHNTLQEENATLQTGLDVIAREQKALQTSHDRLSGRYDELVERVMPVFEILAREKLMEINTSN